MSKRGVGAPLVGALPFMEWQEHGRDQGRTQGPPLQVAQIAIPVPVPEVFSYKIPPEWQERARIGSRVRVSFRNRELTGYLVEKKMAPVEKSLKPILAVLDEAPVLSQNILDLTQWISQYYGSSWGEAIENALPRWVKYGKKAERAIEKCRGAVTAPTAGRGNPAPTDFVLTSEQQAAMERIQASLREENPRPVLLRGVTGSGKSELYIRIIRQVLDQGRCAICLVPEIALTEQLQHFFRGRFGTELEVLHSKLTDSERFLAWKRIERGERRVVLGPRSAVFAPLQALGLIIMDEEHENSYKQETTPRYHAREVASWRAQKEKALFLMGSATPSLEARYRAQAGDFELLELSQRVDARSMPEVFLIDLKEAPTGPQKTNILSTRLACEIESNLKNREGTLLLLNRRGFSTHIHCPHCGMAETCLSCQVSLTFHQENDILLCHYCNYQKPVPTACSNCHAPLLRFGGFGTEKVESELGKRFPLARIARLDTDSVKKRGSHEKILRAFREKQVDILIGTQMIAKGFDFPHVTLVGVILADVGLMLPDFRSAERTFQLLTQVAGRAGRGELPGRVFIQTYSPDHPSIRFAKDHDYVNFFQHEMRERAEHRYPPLTQLINFIIRSKTEKKSYAFARSLRDFLRQEFQPAVPPQTPELEIIGPAPLPFYKLRGHYRWHVMIKSSRSRGWAQNVAKAVSKLKRQTGVAMVMDVDPLNIL